MKRLVPLGDLIQAGIQEQEAHTLCGSDLFIEWHKLARFDGGTALVVLDDAEIELLKAELLRQGLPAKAFEDAPHPGAFIANLVWHSAVQQCPTGNWYDHSLVSAVACAILLGLAQEAWGFDPEAHAKRESEKFASVLGVAKSVEAI